MVWVFCALDLCVELKPVEIMLKFTSSTKYKVKHVGSDSNFDFARHLIFSGIKENYKKEIDSMDFYNKCENNFKNTGIGFRCALINQRRNTNGNSTQKK